MVKCAFENIRISGISCCVPEKEYCLLNEQNLYNGDKKRINRVINSSGFLKRRVSEKDVMTSDLCFQAAKNLFCNTQVKKEDIEAIIFISYTPDYLLPATSYILHKKLNLSKDCIALDVPQACSGFIIGLYQGAMLLTSGCNKVLICVGDSFSKFTDMFKDNTAQIFGDAGTAILLEKYNNNSKTFFNIETYSQDYDALICENSGFKHPPQKDDFYSDNSFIYDSKMDGKRIFNFTLEKVAPNILGLLNFSNIKKENIDKFVFHQANKFILENIAKKINIDSSLISTQTLRDYGNQCGASIPCTISNTLKNYVENQGGKFLLSGFGAGLSVASCIIDIGNIYCSELVNYRR